MRSDPDLRLFWTAGYFDLTTPAYAARYALDRTGIPADRLTAAYFPGAHSVFDEEANLAELAESVRRFVRGSDRSTGDGSFEGARSQLAPRTAHRPPNGLALHDVPLELERILAHRATILARHKGAH
jgi:hypothetical protein